MDHSSGNDPKLEKMVSTQYFFGEVIAKAAEKRRLDINPYSQRYLIDLLEFYITSTNLQMKDSLAETLLKAQQAEKTVRLEMLKRLGDTSLYISGFFGDSLKRKIVDIDYYVDIGGVAYGSLAAQIEEDISASVYRDFSARFSEYVDLLTYVSQNAMIQSNQDLLRLYERYVTTGSELAREQLLEKGLLTASDLKKISNQ